MADSGVEAMLVSAIDNVRWLTGFSGSSGYAIVTPDKATFITDSRYDEAARELVRDLDVEIYKAPQTLADVLVASANEMGADKLWFEAEHVSVATMNAWKAKFNGIALEPAEDLVDPLRMVKTPDEIAIIRRACGVTDACLEHVSRMLQVGVTEYDICLDIEFFIRRQGAANAFPPIVVSGPRSARPHGEPSERKLQEGDFVTMDLGAQVDGYNSDITRTVVIGEPTERHKQVWNAVLEAQTAAIDMIRPGVKAVDVDALSREVLDKYDLARFFGHGLGHGLGSVVHDVGGLNTRSKDIIAEGQIWTVEPGVYIPGFGGVRIEDDVAVSADGCEILTRAPKRMNPV
jgi:Xaa-Pro aminopeptidase